MITLNCRKVYDSQIKLKIKQLIQSQLREIRKLKTQNKVEYLNTQRKQIVYIIVKRHITVPMFVSDHSLMDGSLGQKV